MGFLGKDLMREHFEAERARKKQSHPEGFCLMRYQDQVTQEVEVIWNSRDGVTPFCITSKAGNESRHATWDRDQWAPDHKPKPGDRLFADLTIDKARVYAQRQVAQWWDHPEYPMRERFDSQTEAVAAIATGMLEPAGQPDLVVVGHDGDWD